MRHLKKDFLIYSELFCDPQKILYIVILSLLLADEGYLRFFALFLFKMT